MSITWSQLYEVGNSRALRFSYVWLIVVPMMAKFLVRLNGYLKFEFYGQQLEFEAGLPFSWPMFYFASVCFSVAGLLYAWKCPPLVKNFKTYSDYVEEGRGPGPLVNLCRVYGDKIGGHAVDEFIDAATFHRRLTWQELREPMAGAFWALRAHLNRLQPKTLAACAALYALGFVLIAGVIVQNFVFVVRAVL